MLLFAMVLLPTAGLAQVLSESDLLFNPDSITPDYYPRNYLDDLTVNRIVVWTGGADPIVGAQILPDLTHFSYASGYSFSYADYLRRPSNGDYSASLVTGDLSATFNTAGIYHVRVMHQSGASSIEAVFADAGFAEKNGKPDRSGASGQADGVPEGDLFLVDTPDPVTQRLTQVFVRAGRQVTKISSRADAIEKVKQWSNFSGRKIHVEFVGHGTAGGISMGAGKEDIPEQQLDQSSADSFGQALAPYVNKITFQGCSVGEGSVGLTFLTTLSNYFGTAGGYTAPIYCPDSRNIEIQKDGYFRVVPEPATMIALGLALSVVMRRRRR